LRYKESLTTVFMKQIDSIRNQEKLRETKAILAVITHMMVVPLFLAFWICDFLYVPDMKWEFLIVRSMVVPLSLYTRFQFKKILSFYDAQLLALFYISGLALLIHYMVYRIGDWSTPYYAGLNLITIGSISFIPWTWRFFFASIGTIFLPYFFGAIFLSQNNTNSHTVVLNMFFISGTIVISIFLRILSERLRRKEVESRQLLREEIISRGKIIDEKTNEALKLTELSRQFSPQVVEAIRTNQVLLTDSVHRSNICAIFVDIVNSTERVSRIDKDKVTRVISHFMMDSARVLLKYDITIDKFLGDGLLAFSNDPVSYPDYIERVLRAAIEIRERVSLDQEFYEVNWLKPLEIRIGIATGFANVGFYGNRRYFHSYTAIGPVINLASRLCGVASPGQILVPHDLVDVLKPNSEFQFEFIGKKSLKGFESDAIQVFEMITTAETRSLDSMGILDCPKCSQVMHIDKNDTGFFVLRCRNCGHSLDQNLLLKNIAEKSKAS
jgi:adenylate cyclase